MGRSMLLIISVGILHTLCHGSPIGIGSLDLKLRTPEGRNFNPVQFAKEWVDSVSVPVFPVSSVVRNVEIVPVAKAVPVPLRSTPILVQRESFQEPVVVQNVQPAAISPIPTVNAAPLVVDPAPVDVESTANSGSFIVETPSIVVEPVLKPATDNVKQTQIVIEHVKASHLVVEPAPIVAEPIEKAVPLVENVVEEFSPILTPIVQRGPTFVAPAVAPFVRAAPVIIETVAEPTVVVPVFANVVKSHSVITNIVETEPIKTLASVTPHVNIISHAAPIVKTTPAKGDIPTLKPIPVVAGDAVQTVETKAELIIAEVPAPIVTAVVPIVKTTPDIIAAVVPVVKTTPEVIVAVGPEPLDAPNPPIPTPDVPFRGGQFHAQDENGQYAFGYYGGSSTRVEAKDSLGRVSGSFAYVNPDGDVQVRKYSAAPGVGFKVAASDLPADTPEVAEVKEAHIKLISDTRSSNA
ncbi:unnamed protein product [Meganyctiphanes norvegica]|uniref:Cuticle protein n=1 Tax=Meganyctiphanes norvegica TaxID=48144 RepID=A0AAV2PRL6_MEGNR